ncbi:MAG: PD-(D/E)XK nuclease family protein, partial [Chromatiales bacterium]
LWRAWQDQLEAMDRQDPARAYLEALNADAGGGSEVSHLYVLATIRLLPAEAAWLRRRLDSGRASLWLPGRRGQPGYRPDGAVEAWIARVGLEPTLDQDEPDPTGALLDAALDWGETPLAERARAFAARHPTSPLSGRLQIAAAAGAEQQARVVEIQVRRWLLQGLGRIGIVTQDRRLARRLRALLERAGLLLQDGAGWALSTSSAGATLERWLETVEEDFAYRPMLDVLKSPFMAADGEREAHLATVYRLERDIVHRENIARGLARYHRQLRYRAERLPAWAEEAAGRIETLLDRLARAAAPLEAVIDDRPHTAAAYLSALEQSLRRLGLWDGLESDAAGARIIEELRLMRGDTDSGQTGLRWPEFRGWLGRTLETRYFRPQTGPGPVELLELEAAHSSRFDALVIAAAEATHLPGEAAPAAFFNDEVRRELGLSTWTERAAEQLYRFRCLLQAAPRVLITYERERDDEPVVPSPWVEVIQVFHRLAYGDDLDATELIRLTDDERARVAALDPAPPPAQREMPRPAAPTELLPERLSVGRAQTLIDCPYRFFAAECLGLQPPEEIVEALQKADYGERVHLCLQAFHGDVPGLPGPFAETLNAANRDAAVALLETIARQVFARDLEDNFLHRGWLHRWLSIIPRYIDWQLKRSTDWSVSQTEAGREITLDSGLMLRGRIDRIDRDAKGRLALIDYKTGGTAQQDEVDAGEAVQLTAYALLVEGVRRVEYVQLKNDGTVRVPAHLEGEQLESLREQVRDRMEHLQSRLQAGHAMPAWGDPRTCKYCEMAGLCRRAEWSAD